MGHGARADPLQQRLDAISVDHMFDTRYANVAWNYEHGGIYGMTRLKEATEFLQAHGFVVVKDVMRADCNSQALDALIQDLHEVNPSTSQITSLADFREEDLP